MREQIWISVNGARLSVTPGSTVASAVVAAGIAAFRRSISGEPRGPLCGMGVCFECVATIDGVPRSRTCQTLCESGMEIVTDASV